ncbi:ABC transporter permease [Pseudonocardia endophytica]|uniref:Osmoprotectant transport system permease protein n=1 Tax=Pseudonocardia endophytica TaxID=401976 RepID=A0A4R1HRW9_PSEEN|nr:ABC transporter permease [Pseudonocardia endophytica]TCK24918.1 osmoprotectant transport system permease protein [Pseudonocardia endophytica]
MIQYLTDNFGRLLLLTLGHAILALVALVISVVVGVAVGAYVGHLHKYAFLAINLGNVLRALPTLALIAVMIALIGFGFVNITIALVVLALPLILTNAYTAVAGVDRGMVEAARGMGMADNQILFQVELPNAIPLIMTGVRTAWVYTVATAYLAIFAGYATRPGQLGTLGDIIGNPSGESTQGILVAAVFAIVLAFVGAGLLTLAERAMTPTGIKLARAAAMAPA